MVLKWPAMSGISMCSVALALAQPAWAQEEAAQQSDGLSDIVVTAQKREQNLQNVGISVTAYSGEEIRSRGVATSIDLIVQTPSVDNYSPYGPGSSANIVIRGVGLNDFGEGNEAPVTMYVDEFYIVNVPALDFALFDVARAEILRGPQGTLFGRNSTGGLVNYVTERPQNEAGGYVKASFARFNELKVEGAVNLPITDNLSGRLSFVSHHSDGYVRNLNLAFSHDKGGAAGTDAVRAQLRWKPGNWDVLLKAEFGRTSTVTPYYELIPSVNDPVSGLGSLNPTGTDAAGYNENNFGAGARNVTFTDGEQRLRSHGTTLLLRAENEVADHLNFTSVTGYQNYNRHFTEDSDGSPNDTASHGVFPFQSDSASQEFRLFYNNGPLRWTAGVYGLYSHSTNQPDAIFNVPLSGPAAVDPSTGLYNGAYFPVSLSANWRLRTTSVAAFAQGEFDIAPTLTFLIGGRLTHDNKNFTDFDNASLRSCPGGGTNCFSPPRGTGVPNPFHGVYKKTLWSGKAEIDFKPTDDLLLFASVSRGTKSGGFSNGFYPGGVSTAALRYGDETNISYEIGEKISLFDRKLRINTSAFYYDYNDFQTFSWVGVGGILTNHDARSYGVETEIQAAPTRDLRLSFGGSYLDTKIEGVSRNGLTTFDSQMANAPHWTANGSVVYTIPLQDDRSIVLSWSGNYRSSRYTNNFNDPSVLLPGYFKHNAEITYNLSDDLHAQVFVRNISNNIAATKAFQFDALSYAQFIYSEPRVFGASVMYSW